MTLLWVSRFVPRLLCRAHARRPALNALSGHSSYTGTPISPIWQHEKAMMFLLPLVRLLGVAGVVFLANVAWAQKAPPATLAPGQCECTCERPRLTLEPAAPIAACSGLVPPAKCPCVCAAKQTRLKDDDKPASSLRASVSPLVRQGPVVVAQDIDVSGPRGSVFVLGASFRDDSPHATWSPWVTTRRYDIGPSGQVRWENFQAEVPDNDFTTRRFQIRLAVFDGTARLIAEASKTFTARATGAPFTEADMRFDNSPAAPPSVAAPSPGREKPRNAGEIVDRFAAGPSFSSHYGPRVPSLPNSDQKVRHTAVTDSPIVVGSSPSGVYLAVQAESNDESPGVQALSPSSTIRYDIAMNHCSAAAARQGKPTIAPTAGPIGRAAVQVRRQISESEDEYVACAESGAVMYGMTSEGRLYLSLDVAFTDGSRTKQSLWIDSMHCRPNPPCL